MGEAAVCMNTTFDPNVGYISLGKKSEGGGNFSDQLPIRDRSEVSKETLESRIEEEIEVKFVENQRLVVNGRKLNFHREGESLYTFLGANGNAREWTLVDAEKRTYTSIDWKGNETSAYVIDIESGSSGKPTEVPQKPPVKIENLKEISGKKLQSKGRSYPLYECEGDFYTIQGKGGAPCPWSKPDEKGNIWRYNTKNERIEGVVVEVAELPKVEKPKNIEAKKSPTDFIPTYFWLRLSSGKLRF
jgi:hypothetical protein